MAKLYTEITQKLQQFIEDQKIFFVATATADSRINLSPKGMDSLRVIRSEPRDLVKRNRQRQRNRRTHSRKSTNDNYAYRI